MNRMKIQKNIEKKTGNIILKNYFQKYKSQRENCKILEKVKNDRFLENKTRKDITGCIKMLEMREELLNSGFILNFSDKRDDLQGKNL